MLSKRLMKIVKDWFLVGMISAVVLATLWPGFAASGGPIHADKLGDVGIFLIFLFHGAGISPQSLKQGLSNIKLHAVIQVTTFVVFPLLWFVFRAAFSFVIPHELMLGFLYLCALPSTISSSVALTAVGRGNVPAAIFNATLSSLLGIVLTPLIISVAIDASGEGLSMVDAVVKIATMLLLPFLIGQALRPVCGDFFKKHKKTTNTFDKIVILFLVFNSFSDSVKGGLWTNYGVGTLFLTILGAALILGFILVFNTMSARFFGFDGADEVTCVMCASKKTLASGVPMAKLLFGAHPALGIIVLPIMFYHQLQLFACSIIAERYAKRQDAVQEARSHCLTKPAASKA